MGKIPDPILSDPKIFEFGSDWVVNKTRSDKIFKTRSGCDRIGSNKPDPKILLGCLNKNKKTKPKWLHRVDTNTMAHSLTPTLSVFFLFTLFFLFFLFFSSQLTQETTKLQTISTAAAQRQHATRPDLLHWRQDLLAVASTIASLHFDQICFSGSHRWNPRSHEPSMKPVAVWSIGCRLTRAKRSMVVLPTRPRFTTPKSSKLTTFSILFQFIYFFMIINGKWKWTKMN